MYPLVYKYVVIYLTAFRVPELILVSFFQADAK